MNTRDLSVLSFSAGFTMWLYNAEHLTLAEVCAASHLDLATVREGDMMIVRCSEGMATVAILYVTGELAGVPMQAAMTLRQQTAEEVRTEIDRRAEVQPLPVSGLGVTMEGPHANILRSGAWTFPVSAPYQHVTAQDMRGYSPSPAITALPSASPNPLPLPESGQVYVCDMLANDAANRKMREFEEAYAVDFEAKHGKRPPDDVWQKWGRGPALQAMRAREGGSE